MPPFETNRRRFLAGGISLAAGAALARTARGLAFDDEPRTLVLVQLTGGNDGLNTVVPYADDAYHAARRTLGLAPGAVLRLDERVGLHPSLAGLRRIYDAGELAVVQGVGYEDAVRSHFKSYEIWHTARSAGRASGDGWVARLVEAAWADAPGELVVHVGREAPYSVYSSTRPAVALDSPSAYRWFGDAGQSELGGCALDPAGAGGTPQPAPGRDALLAKLRGVQRDARSSSARIQRAALDYRPSVEYPRNGRLGAALRDVAALIHGGLGTRVFSTAIGSFDTHANQESDHARLLAELDGALAAFQRDLAASAAGRRTLVMVFSEFGRRVAENGSRGTDHGKAGPMFLLGPAVEGGLHGAHPSLTDLDDGDLAHTVDFRSVYATVIERWFGVPHETVLGARYETQPLLRA